MCGIFGILSEKTLAFDRVGRYKNFLSDATIASSLRGMDSSGVFGIKRSGEAEVTKRPIAPWDFLCQVPTPRLYSDVNDYSIVVGHVRSATRGNPSYSNSHPFHHGNIIMVHNGTLNNVTSMGQAWKYGTDSEHIAKALDEADDPIKVLEKINGAFALVWYDKRTDSTYLARNKQRELHYGECVIDKTVVIASEWKMLEWIAGRNGIDIKQTWQVEANTLVKIPRKDISKMEIVEFEEYKEPPFIYKGYNRPRAETSGVIYTLSPEDLRKNGFSKGKIIKFEPLDVFLPKAKSKSGILEGIMIESPWFMVRAGGVDIRKIFNSEQLPLMGQVLGMINADGLSPVVVLSNIEVAARNAIKMKSSARTHISSVGLLDASLWPLDAQRTHSPTTPIGEKRVEDSTNSTIITPETKGSPFDKENLIELRNIKGPAGKLITTKEYELLTKHGCGFCQGDLPIASSVSVTWIQDAPVCATCYNETSGNRLN